MGKITKLRKFLNLDGKTMLLFLEAFFYLGLARLLILFPFSKISPSLGIHMKETSEVTSESSKKAQIQVYEAIRIMGEHTFWKSTCLVRAIAAMKMLERRRVESTLYMGTARDETGQMIAHAWLRSGAYYITGADVMSRFTVVAKFAKTVKQ